MTDKQRKYIESLIKKVFRNADSQSEGAIYFKNKEDAQAVIDNPNFRSILDAIYKD